MTQDYFDSYDDIAVHNLMLRDDPRVSIYREAILSSEKLFKDKIVLDVGCGTGILSLFCSQAGARHVYAVEASKGISILAQEIIKSNKLESKITVINGEIEKIELPVAEVDIIVSEWMGMYLLHESMLNSVIDARDRFLRKDGAGLMYPSIAYLYMCPVEMTGYIDDQLNKWNSFYNLNFEPVRKVYEQLLLEKPIVEQINESQLISNEKIVATIDINKVDKEDLKHIQMYQMKFYANRQSKLHGFALWFDVVFQTDNKVITLNTSPSSKPTHWKQTISLLPTAISSTSGSNSIVDLNEDDSFECYLIMSQSDTNTRNYTIDIGITAMNEASLFADNESDGADEEQHMSDETKSDGEDEEDEEEHPIPCDCGDMKCIIIKATLEKYEKEKEVDDL